MLAGDPPTGGESVQAICSKPGYFLVKWRSLGGDVSGDVGLDQCKGFIIRSSDLYLVGVKNNQSVQLIGSDTDRKKVADGIDARTRNWTVLKTSIPNQYQYLSFEREDLEFTAVSVIKALDTFVDSARSDLPNDESTAKGIVMAIVVISEAARFRRVQQHVRNGLEGRRGDDAKMDTDTVELTNDWAKVSKLFWAGNEYALPSGKTYRGGKGVSPMGRIVAVVKPVRLRRRWAV